MQLQYAHWFFLFYKVRSPTPWMFYFSGLSAMPDLRSLSRVPLRSWGSFWLFDSVVFIGGFNVVGDVDFAFHARYPWGSVLFNSVFSSLVSRSPISFNCNVMRQSCLFFSLCEGAPKFLEGILRYCEEMSWEVFYLPSIISVLWLGRYWRVVFTSLWKAFFSSRLYS